MIAAVEDKIVRLLEDARSIEDVAYLSGHSVAEVEEVAAKQAEHLVPGDSP